LKAKLLSQTGDLKKAEENISKALKFDAKDELYWETMSDILYQKQDFAGCKNCLEAAVQRNPKSPKYLRNLSIILRCTGRGKKSFHTPKFLFKIILHFCINF